MGMPEHFDLDERVWHVYWGGSVGTPTIEKQPLVIHSINLTAHGIRYNVSTSSGGYAHENCFRTVDDAKAGLRTRIDVITHALHAKVDSLKFTL